MTRYRVIAEVLSPMNNKKKALGGSRWLKSEFSRCLCGISGLNKLKNLVNQIGP